MNTHSKLELIYENMLTPIGALSITQQQQPVQVTEIEEEMSEADEVKIAKQILKQVDQLDMAASEAAVKTYRRKLESIADAIRDLTSLLIQGHPGV